MANPTGSTYLAANNSYTWVDGDIYEIVQTDQVEGGTPGVTTGSGAASFSGLGVENQPHQVLLNKIQYTHTKQLADEVNIANLMTFEDLFTSAVGTSGYLKAGAQDVNLGQIDIIFQWGTLNLIGSSYSILQSSVPLSFNFPIAFPNACWVLHPWWQTNWSAQINQSMPLVLQTFTPLAKQTNKIVICAANNYLNPSTTQFATGTTTGSGITGIGWWALGY
jgi:hypothetical protein